MTGYVRLDLPNRSHAEYERLGGRLVEVAERAGFPVVVAGGAVDDCWHWPVSDGARLPEGNPDKDTRAFHAVQHQKTAWVADAAERLDVPALVWLDFGILHVPGVTEEAVVAFLERASRPARAIGMASIWGPPGALPWPQRVAWHCAGGAFVAPARLARAWHEQVVSAAVDVRLRGWATWEVNDWAWAWHRAPHLVSSWPYDHDATLLEAGP